MWITTGAGRKRPRGRRIELPALPPVAAICEALSRLSSEVDSWWSPFVFRGDHRAEERWEGAFLLGLDVDYYASLDPKERGAPSHADRQRMQDAFESLALPGNAAHWTPRGLRLLLVLDAPVTDPETCKRALHGAAELVDRALGELGLRGCGHASGFIVDRSALDLARFLFSPRAIVDGHAREAEVVVLREECYTVGELLAAAPPDKVTRNGRQPRDGDGTAPNKPGEDFNRNGTWQEAFGGVGEIVERRGRLFWKRDGSEHEWNATLDYCKNERAEGLCHVFTPNAPPFEANESYSRFREFALLHFGGDFEAAAQELVARGYGKGGREFLRQLAEIDEALAEIGDRDQSETKKLWPELDPAKDHPRQRFFPLGHGENGLDERCDDDLHENNPTNRPKTDSPTPKIDGPLTDLRAGELLVEMHGPDLHYCKPWGQWLAWDGARWAHDRSGEVERRAKDVARSLADRAAAEFRRAADGVKAGQAEPGAAARAKRLLTEARRLQSDRALRAMIHVAQSEPGVPVLPEQLDADPWLLCVQNGVVDLRTGELREHRRDDLMTKQAGCAFDPQAKAPQWERFLRRIMNDNEELIAFLQRVVGYSLTGSTAEQVWFFLHGSGANGKSVFLTTLQATLGDYAKQGAPDLLLAKRGESHPTELADLHGARSVVCTEVESGRRFDEGRIKQITGGDLVSCRRMRQDFWSFIPQCKLFLAANHRPRVEGTDHAFWRRVRLIPFSVTIPAGEQDRKLPEKLRGELDGILQWALRGLAGYREHGLQAPPSVRAATVAYRKAEDRLGEFLATCCIDGRRNTMAAGASVPKGKLYEAYRAWATTNGEHPVSQRKLSGLLTDRGFQETRMHGGQRGWRDVGLRAEGDHER